MTVIDKVLNELVPCATSKNIKLVTKVAPKETPFFYLIYGDQSRYASILTCLIAFAYNRSPANSNLTVELQIVEVAENKKMKARTAVYKHFCLNDLRLSMGGSHYIKFTICVRDEGPLISEATKKNLFIDLRADAKRIEEGDLDLSLAHDLLKQMSGDVSITSDKEKGTEINICCITQCLKSPEQKHE